MILLAAGKRLELPRWYRFWSHGATFSKAEMNFCSRDFIASLRDAISFSFEYVSRLKDAKSGLERAYFEKNTLCSLVPKPSSRAVDPLP